MSDLLSHSGAAYASRASDNARRLSEALAIIDNAARESLLDQAPHHAIALLTEDEQRRLYVLLKGTE